MRCEYCDHPMSATRAGADWSYSCAACTVETKEVGPGHRRRVVKVPPTYTIRPGDRIVSLFPGQYAEAIITEGHRYCGSPIHKLPGKTYLMVR